MNRQLPPELNELADNFRNMKKEASAFFSGLNSALFNKKPESGGWSAGECIDHLIVTGDDYCNKFEEALIIAEEKNLKLKGDLKISWFGKRFIKFIQPNAKFKTRTSKKWRPDLNINKPRAVAAYLQLQDRWVDLINRSAGLDISKVKLPSPVTGIIKFSAYEMLLINEAHQRRHLEQAKRAADNK